MTLTKESIRTLLKQVKDPEIPVISVIDMGIVKNIKVKDDRIEVDLVPTFAGCPAVGMMAADIKKTCLDAGAKEVIVNIRLNQSWSSNDLSEEGRKKILKFGVNPPPKFKGEINMKLVSKASCPQCGSANTILKSTFGPTACRSIHYCHNCLETFEQMKPL